MKNEKQIPSPEELAQAWGAPFVARNQQALDRATGGVIKLDILPAVNRPGFQGSTAAAGLLRGWSYAASSSRRCPAW